MYLQGLGAYYTKNGLATSSYVVGDTMGFNVPGYSQVWLEQTQNGSPQYSGPFTIPMSPYVLQARDAGVFNASVYEYKNGAKGKLIGTDSVTVAAAPAQQTFAPPQVQQIQAPGYTNPSVTSSGAAIMPSGVATPSAPTPIYISTPGAPIDFGAPIDTGVPAPEVQAAGFPPVGMLLLAGLGLYFVFGGKRQ